MEKDTKGKLRLNLLPPHALESIAKVREFGVSKYPSAWGWVTGVKTEDLIEATKRHLLKIDMGETKDPESGLLHIEHALCSLAMAVHQIKAGQKIQSDLLNKEFKLKPLTGNINNDILYILTHNDLIVKEVSIDEVPAYEIEDKISGVKSKANDVVNAYRNLVKAIENEKK